MWALKTGKVFSVCCNNAWPFFETRARTSALLKTTKKAGVALLMSAVMLMVGFGVCDVEVGDERDERR